MEELENVPRGHGNILAKFGLLSPGIRLNPEAIRAVTIGLPRESEGYLT